MNRANAQLHELAQLVRQTCQLWPAGWVAYNWRNYTFDHIQRVRGLAVTLSEREDADTDICEMAALRHDLTKLYDGEYRTDNAGRRLVDSEGLWISAVREPEASNEVTCLYDRLHLYGQVHSHSSAALAWHLLRKRGLPHPFRARVAEAIEAHLGPPASASREALCLYDADVIDANIGLPAFVRHIYIHLHFYDQWRTSEQPPASELLTDSPRAYLEPYLSAALPAWITGKARDFPPQLRTASGRALALQRLAGLRYTADQLLGELDNWDANSSNGGLAVLLQLLRHAQEPSIADEIALLSDGWLEQHTPCGTARSLIRRLAAESAGTC